MSREYTISTIMLYPLDDGGMRVQQPHGKPEGPISPERIELTDWRVPTDDERSYTPSRLIGDEWLTEDGKFIDRGEPKTLTADEWHRVYDAIWRNMDRENNLINQRISWSIMLTGGFLTAQSFVLGRVIEILSTGNKHTLTPTAYALMIIACGCCALLSGVAALFSRQTMYGVDAAQRQLMYLKRRYDRLRGKDGKSLFQDLMRLPRPFGNN